MKTEAEIREQLNNYEVLASYAAQVGDNPEATAWCEATVTALRWMLGERA